MTARRRPQTRVLWRRRGTEDTLTSELLRLTVPVLVLISGCVGAAQSQNLTRDVFRWRPVDLAFTPTGTYANPFLDVWLKAALTGPGGESLTVPGFYDDDRGYVVRVSLPMPGRWTFATSSNDPGLNGHRGELRCLANPNSAVRGALKVDPARPHHFVYEDGTPCFLMGFECDWLGMLDLGRRGIPLAREVIDLYAQHGFNEVILNVYAHETRWRKGKTSEQDFGPPALFAWGGTNDKPVHSRLNPDFFRTFDRVIAHCMERGVAAHVFLKVYNKLVNWPQRMSPEDDLYFSYVTARYQAYPNVIWDFSKESYNEPDHAYIRNRLSLIRKTDAYNRLCTTHDDDNFYADPEMRSSVDFCTDQNHSDWHTTVLKQRRDLAQPIHVAEYMYEWGKGGPEDKTFGSVQSPEDVLLRTYEVVMAGAYPAYYYTNHAWDVVKADEVPAGLPWYRVLASFFRSTKWYAMSPDDTLIESSAGAHCLADPGREYVLFLPHGGDIRLSVPRKSPVSTRSVRWVRCHTGEEQTSRPDIASPLLLTSPWEGEPAAVHVVLH